jgi:hypothetical protein
MTSVRDRVAQMFGQHVADVLSDALLLRAESSLQREPDFYRLYFRLDPDMKLTEKMALEPLHISYVVRDAIASKLRMAFVAKLFDVGFEPVQPRYSYGQTRFYRKDYWTPERVEKAVGWHFFDFPKLKLANAQVTLLSKVPDVQTRLVACVSEEVRVL